MLHDELVERRGRRNEYRTGTPATPPCTASALPGRSNGARIARHHASIERANIDSQLESIRGHDSAYSAFAQPTFDLAPFSGQIPTAVAANWFCLARLRRIRLLQIGEQNFRVQSAVGEDNRLQLAGKQFLGYSGRFIDIAPPNAEVPVDHRRIVENEMLFSSRRPILFDNPDFPFDELRCQFAGIRNRGGAADELRSRTIELSNLANVLRRLRRMATEDAAIGVQFIENDIA